MEKMADRGIADFVLGNVARLHCGVWPAGTAYTGDDSGDAGGHTGSAGIFGLRGRRAHVRLAGRVLV